MTDSTAKSLLSFTPALPTWKQARAFLNVMPGVPYVAYRHMYDRIWDLKGSPQETEDWTDPDAWIPERLDGEDRALAWKIWRDTAQVINPRYTRGCWYLANKHGLLTRDAADQLQLTPAGQDFLNHPGGEQQAHIDQGEGLLTVLQLVAEHSPCKRGEILPDYAQFCNTYTTYRSSSVHRSSLHDRLVNLVERALVHRSGVSYEITEAGIRHLQKFSSLVPGRQISSRQTQLQELARELIRQARQELREHLSAMDPYEFERLVGLLLEEMGYANVTVTAPSNDKGVDVVADIELGISSVREVVQVKRQGGSINRTVLDQLRGSLHRFKALRGTIITLGTFSTGAKSAALESGAAPITLIDGEKLLDLLVQYEIGVARRAVEFIEFDLSRLAQPAEEPE